MAKKKAKKEPKKDLLDAVDLSVEAELKLDTITMSRMRWRVRIFVESILPKTHHIYKVVLFLNETPKQDSIDKLLEDIDNSLFKDSTVERKRAEKMVHDLEVELAQLRELCENIEFIGRIEELKWKDSGTQLIMVVPDDAIAAFNKHKTRFDLYKIRLIPASF